MLNILIVSDKAGEIYELFSSGGLPSTGASSGGEGSDRGYDLALLDLDSPAWQERLSSLRLEMPVIAFSEPDVSKAVEAMRLGAADYMQKPLTEAALAEAISKHKKKLLSHKHGLDEIIGASGPMQEVFALLKKAAASESNVLITGESGTGKELIARAVHRYSPRSEMAFMTINCSAIPDTLLESELFGFEKGSFTGANYTKRGLLELASGGTVFLDEIGDVSLLFQMKILRVLQEGEIMRVGGAQPIKTDIRIIAATNTDLRAACKTGAFRDDLYYRLNVINIHLPPLRDRKEDIPLLAGYFVKKHASKRKDLLIRDIAPATLAVLMGHAYPGNVRELENIVERAISFANGPELLPADLPPYLTESAAPSGEAKPAKLRDSVRATEREVITAALRLAGGNISRAAASLGIYRQQLQRKIKALKIEV